MTVRVVHIAQRLSNKYFLKNERKNIVHNDPLVLQWGKSKWVTILKYGVVVFWNFKETEEREFIDDLKQNLSDTLKEPLKDEISIKETPTQQGVVKDEYIHLKVISPENIALVSLILGRSLALERFEREVEQVIDDFGILMRHFEEKGSANLSAKALLKKVGFAMNIRNLAIGQMALLDKPDLTWEDKELEQLYIKLLEEYELEDRYEILKEKLDMIFQNIEFIVNYLDTKRSLALEITIVVLIVIEILLFFYEHYLL
jgi:uncharacterized Rmd1/YagE family protein